MTHDYTAALDWIKGFERSLKHTVEWQPGHDEIFAAITHALKLAEAHDMLYWPARHLIAKVEKEIEE